MKGASDLTANVAGVGVPVGVSPELVMKLHREPRPRRAASRGGQHAVRLQLLPVVRVTCAEQCNAACGLQTASKRARVYTGNVKKRIRTRALLDATPLGFKFALRTLARAARQKLKWRRPFATSGAQHRDPTVYSVKRIVTPSNAMCSSWQTHSAPSVSGTGRCRRERENSSAVCRQQRQDRALQALRSYREALSCMIIAVSGRAVL